ncbi:MAG: GGDEF domain-containing protein [Clostridiales bacterium]|nr:GGDEF domain-containing protein [Clostridiales bacterium]
MKKRTVGNAHQLFLEVINRLGAQGDPHDTIPGILRATCRFFHFGCGFIYETGSSGIFELGEVCGYYEKSTLPPSLDIFNVLTGEQVQELIALGTVVIRADDAASGLKAGLQGMFNCRLLVLVPIINNEGELIGVVGMSDRRGEIVLSAADFEKACSVLRMAGNQIKLRIYQKWLENTRNAMKSILDNVAVDICVTDFATYEIIYANSSMATTYGGTDNILGKQCWRIQHSDQNRPCADCKHDKLPLDESGNPVPGLICSRDFLRPQDNTWQRVISTCFRWVDGRLASVVSSTNISENKRNEELIRHLAEYDDLTGLPNRRRLLKDIDNLFSGGSGEGYVLFFDLDGFKRINDNLGHQAGDELLHQVGLTLQNSPFTAGQAYRHSGDEFVLVFRDISPARLLDMTGCLLERFAEPWQLQESTVNCGCSLGIACCPKDGTKALELLHAADQAMYASKKNGHGKVHFYEGGRTITGEEWYSHKEPAL